jgi:hypothetical protein
MTFPFLQLCCRQLDRVVRWRRWVDRKRCPAKCRPWSRWPCQQCRQKIFRPSLQHFLEKVLCTGGVYPRARETPENDWNENWSFKSILSIFLITYIFFYIYWKKVTRLIDWITFFGNSFFPSNFILLKVSYF